MRKLSFTTLLLLCAYGCGGSTPPNTAPPPPPPPVDAGPPPVVDAGPPMDAVVDTGPPAPPPPNRTRDYLLRWRFDSVPAPTENTGQNYAHVVLEVHSASGMQEVDTEVTDANCVDDRAHLSRRAVARAKCFWAGAGWEIEVMYRDATIIVRRRAVDQSIGRNAQWHPVTRIEVRPRSTIENP